MPFKIGEKVDSPSGKTYRIIDPKRGGKDELGKGGFGIVYLVQDDSRIRYALKTPNPLSIKIDMTLQIAQLEEESKLLFELEKVENVVRPVEIFETKMDGITIPALIMEEAKGIALDKYLDRSMNDPQMSTEAIVNYVSLICSTMKEVHSHEVLHRDLTSRNLFIEPHPTDPGLTIIDFGISARCGNSTLFTSFKIPEHIAKAHSPYYAPPEQGDGVESLTTDIFTVGAVANELFTWIRQPTIEPDFPYYSPNSMMPPYSPRLDDQTDECVQKATYRDRRKRYHTMEEFSLALRGELKASLYPRIIKTNGEIKALNLESGQEIWIGRRMGTTDTDARIEMKERTAKGGKTLISRHHAVIKMDSDGIMRVYDLGVPRPGRPHIRQSTNKTWFRFPGAGLEIWRALPIEGIPLMDSELELGFGLIEETKIEDAGGNIIPQGPYRSMSYLPPDSS